MTDGACVFYRGILTNITHTKQNDEKQKMVNNQLNFKINPKATELDERMDNEGSQTMD